jgi:hypothetical protein
MDSRGMCVVRTVGVALQCAKSGLIVKGAVVVCVRAGRSARSSAWP